MRASVSSRLRPTPMSVRRLTASMVPSPIRLPKPCALPSSGRSARPATRAAVSSRRACKVARIASTGRSDGAEGRADLVDRLLLGAADRSAVLLVAPGDPLGQRDDELPVVLGLLR